MAYNEYVKRLRTTITLDTIWHRSDDDMVVAIKNTNHPYLCLDENGQQLDSKAFSDLLYRKLEEGEGVEWVGASITLLMSHHYIWLMMMMMMVVVVVGGSRLSFVIGGAEGLPMELKQQSGGGSSGSSSSGLLSLSKMTFTHQFARVVLAEQVYRAMEIRKGSSYHKE